jgi:hypothetical protein
MQGTDPSASSGRLSPDGMWRWDGVRWMPVANATPPPPSTPFTNDAATQVSNSPRSSVATIGGIGAIIGAVILIVGCALPYVHYTGDTAGASPNSSVFNGGFPGAWGNVIEPLLVILLGLAAAILVIAWANRTARAFSSAILIAMGLQTMAMFVGYDAAGAAYGQLQAGAFVGPIGAFLIMISGVLAAASLLMTQE